MKKTTLLFIILLFAYLTSNAQGDTVIVLPVNPTVNDSIEIVTYKCNYDITSFLIENDTVIFKLMTNSLIDAVCVLSYDTVNIGKLEQGDWTLMYYYIDQALTNDDSIIYSKIVSFNIGSATGLIPNQMSEEWRVYPVPAKEIIVIENQTDRQLDYGNIKISIFDLTGKKLKSEYITENLTNVYIGDLRTGGYILEITDNSEITNTFVIKE
ncbi:MAG: T9SS type A sorting domain-containing protein [Bacteroidales bacterium]|nr:T9SS type A sorting domain-containing protein [Bacteroidales bacterium]